MAKVGLNFSFEANEKAVSVQPIRRRPALPLNWTLPAPGGQATATAALPGGEVIALPAIQYPAATPLASPTLVPLETGLSFKLGQSGVYCSFEVVIRVTDLHAAGDEAARSALFAHQIQWMLKALDSQASHFNSARHAMGMGGQWLPSGQAAPAATPDKAPQVMPPYPTLVITPTVGESKPVVYPGSLAVAPPAAAQPPVKKKSPFQW